MASILQGPRCEPMMLDEQTHFNRYIEAVPKAELHVHL